MTPRPYALLAELTYRCPLHCPYCSNPTTSRGNELATADWQRVLAEAAALGVLQAGFSGGEPLVREDLPEIVRAARAAGIYTNLITSGVGLTEKRAKSLRAAGLDSVQLSLQADEPALADHIAGAKTHALKLEIARVIRHCGLALSLNVVLHHANIDRLPQIIALAETLEADRIELANVQFYGWGFLNRGHLLPTREQAERAAATARLAKERLAGRVEIFYVLPDYYESRPKPCLQGWGQRYITVNPAGEVLPCPAAASAMPEMRFESVREQSLASIWLASDSFNRFRGTAWLPEPCATCPQREIDFGGCRCQAALITGNASTTDPVCALSPDRYRIDELIARLERGAPLAWTMRQNPANQTGAPAA